MAKLFGSYTSPFVRHCRIAFMEQDMDFEFITIDYDLSAAQSPTRKMPYFEHDGLMLTDSTSILHWIRQQGGRTFLETPEETDLYASANAALDAAINLYLLEKENILPEKVAYLQRHQARIESCLAWFNDKVSPVENTPNDSEWRLACLLDWAMYRKRFSFGNHNALSAFYQSVLNRPLFKETAPPPPA